MSTLTVHPANTDQATAIMLFLDALHVDYKAGESNTDETEYLMKSAAMKEHLQKAAEQEKNDEGVKISPDDIWK